MSTNNEASSTISSLSGMVPNPHETAKPLLAVNLNHCLKLTATNFLSWQLQFVATLEGYSLEGFLDGSHPRPPPTITINEVVSANPAFQTWKRQDRLLFSALIGTLTPTVVPIVSRTQTVQEAYETLVATYATPTRGHIKQIKTQLKNLTKGTKSISEYLHQAKNRYDELALIGKPMDHEDFIDTICDGLDDEYKGIVDNVKYRETAVSFDELHEKLLNRELEIQATQTAILPLPATANTTESRSHGGSRVRGGRSSQRGGRGGRSSPRPYMGYCQACNTQGHTVKYCPTFRLLASQPTEPHSVTSTHGPPWQPRPNTAWSTPSVHQPRANFSATKPGPQQWIMDSGASHHITSDLQNLSLHAPYNGSDEVIVGNGNGMPITHVGSGTLSTPSHTFSLHNILCVPSVRQNLVSISQFCQSNKATVEFSPTCFYVKDQRTGAILFHGKSKNGIYHWSSPVPASSTKSPLFAFSGVKASLFDWHGRLGHPSSQILNKVLSQFSLDTTGAASPLSNCNACQCNKMHKLPFSVSTVVSSHPLHVIYSDVWTSPVLSVDGFKYYVVFIDHFTRYSWLYPLKQKAHVHQTFLSFRALVEKQFSTTIRTLYSDNGGEYKALTPYLTSVGISHLTSPPHTPEHNGISERKHRHIVETGLTLLHHASMPFSYWSYALPVATYLINRLPTPTLSMESPFQCLFSTIPNYVKLRVFGCLCYPWTRPYASHKLQPRSTPCVFIGYSVTQSAYLCLDLSTNRIYVSRHVNFVESLFPFTSQKSTHPMNATPPTDPSPSWDIPHHFVPQPPPDYSPPVTPTSPQSPNPTSPPLLESSPPPRPPSPDAPPPPRNITTRSMNNISKPIQKLNLTAQLPPLSETEPTTVSHALTHSSWRQAMSDEFMALVRNGTWTLVPSSPAQNVVGCKWVFRIKRKPDGSVDRYKARLVAKGFHQRPGVDYSETFSPVIKPTTIRLVLSLAVSQSWPLRQLDVNNAFLQGTLLDQVFMMQPPGFIDKDHPDHVCLLRKALYGLKQAPRAWYNELRDYLLSLGFYNSLADVSLFIFSDAGTTLYILVYVDDIVVTGNNLAKVDSIIALLGRRFSVKDLGPLHFFLGVEVVPHSLGVVLSQRRYILDLLTRTKMAASRPVRTPLATASSLRHDGGVPLSDGRDYRGIIGGLQYLALTRPDISYAVNKLSQFMQAPTTDHLNAAKRVLRYLQGSIDHGLLLRRQSPLSLHAYSDADWAGDKDDFSSTSAYIIFLGHNAISWSSKKQRTIARSSTEAEYRSVASTAAETRWILSLLTELGITIPLQPVIYCDNVGATQLCANPVFHSRMKHVAIDYHFIRQHVQHGILRVSHVRSEDQLADMLTKPLPSTQFTNLCTKIGLSSRHSILRGHDRISQKL